MEKTLTLEIHDAELIDELLSRLILNKRGREVRQKIRNYIGRVNHESVPFDSSYNFAEQCPSIWDGDEPPF